jgi:hypothetical protein
MSDLGRVPAEGPRRGKGGWGGFRRWCRGDSSGTDSRQGLHDSLA